jgi:hypothetical protein
MIRLPSKTLRDQSPRAEDDHGISRGEPWLFERVYAPLAAGLLTLIKADAKLECQRRTRLDHLYQHVIDDLDSLVRAVGLKAA